MTRDLVTGEVLIVITAGNSTVLRFYKLTNPDLRSTNNQLTLIDIWNSADINDFKWKNWQTMHFIQQDDGQLFLACGDNTGTPGIGGEDWIRLFKVIRAGNQFSLQYRNQRHLYLNQPDMGNIEAACGFYVSPLGQLIFYSGEHDNDGPQSTVKMGEFRSYNAVASCGGWIELYEDENGWIDGSPDRSVILDYVDRNADDWNNLDRFGFNDDIDSLRWNLPPGRQVVLYKDSGYRGESITVSCMGSMASLGGFGDKSSSIRFIGGSTNNETLVCLPPGNSSCNAFTIREGLLNLVTCGVPGNMFVRPGSYNEKISIISPVTLSAPDGMVTIGAP